MQQFCYQYGDRPLEGYTIQRAVGRGGFGEVYYALSDSGRQVALKVIQTYEQIELRGIRQCMNLKSPHLVTIFDVKYNDAGKPFVIMEYVSGPSLREIINETPGGLGVQKSAFFLREIGKGLTYLHDSGIVHRDLKPGNIFYENGCVKIGDYGLSKAISVSHHSGQTITVGTVHYMAPEIGKGCYDRSIDIYALGVVLYEMLTGQVPFFGASPGEILMKHMVDEPNVDQIEEPFATVIRKAMAKDPANRYHTVQEMVETVFGAEHVQNSVSHFSPDSLTQIAAHAARRVAVGADPPESDAPSGIDSWKEFGRRMGQVGTEMGKAGEQFGRQMGELGAKIKYVAGGKTMTRRQQARRALEIADPSRDPLSKQYRRGLAATIAVVFAIASTLLIPTDVGHRPGLTALFALLVIVAGASGIVTAVGKWLPKLADEGKSIQHLAVGGLGGILILLTSVPILLWAESSRPEVFGENLAYGTYVSILLALFFIDWRKLSLAGRPERIFLGAAIWAGVLGYAATFVAPLLLSLVGVKHCESILPLVVGSLAGIALAVQVASPFDPTARQRAAEIEGERQLTPEFHGQTVGASPRAETVPPGHHRPARAHPWHQTPASSRVRLVPGFVRVLWLVVFLGLFTAGLMLLIYLAIERLGSDQFGMAIAFGVGSLVSALFCLAKAVRRTFIGWWRYLFKPILLLVCAQTVFTSLMCLGMFRLDSDETLVALFFVIFPSLLFIVIAFIPNRSVEGLFSKASLQHLVPPAAPRGLGISTRRRLWALLLAFPIVFGFGGLQRFYVGKIGTGLLWLVTGGLFGIGQLYDVIMIAVGRFTDRHGRPLVIWQSFDELRYAADKSQAGLKNHDVDYRHESPASANRPAPPPTGPAVEPPAEDLYIPAPSSFPSQNGAPFNLAGSLLSVVGGMLLFSALVIGLTLSAGLPAMVAAGIPDRALAKELEQVFGFAGWPHVVHQVGMTLTVMLILLAAITLIIARRRDGAAHMIRSALGSFGLLLAMSTLANSLGAVSWETIARLTEAKQGGLAMENFFNSTNGETAAIAAVCLLVSIIILAWPPRRRFEMESSASGKGVRI